MLLTVFVCNCCLENSSSNDGENFSSVVRDSRGVENFIPAEIVICSKYGRRKFAFDNWYNEAVMDSVQTYNDENVNGGIKTDLDAYSKYIKGIHIDTYIGNAMFSCSCGETIKESDFVPGSEKMVHYIGLVENKFEEIRKIFK